MRQAEDTGGLRGELGVEFSGEEALGRYLDLHAAFNRFINSKFGRQLDYTGYLSTIGAFGEVPRHHRTSKAYRCVGPCFRFVSTAGDLRGPLVHESASPGASLCWSHSCWPRWFPSKP